MCAFRHQSLHRPSRVAGIWAVRPLRLSSWRRGWTVTAAWPQTSGDFWEEGHSTEVRGHLVEALWDSRCEGVDIDCTVCVLHASPLRSQWRRRGWTVWEGSGGVQLCVQATGEQTGACWAGLGLQSQCLPAGVLRGLLDSPIAPCWIFGVFLSVVTPIICMSRSWCLILAVKCTYGMDRMFPPAGGASLSSWFTNCGPELMTTATAESIHWIPRSAIPACHCKFTLQAVNLSLHTGAARCTADKTHQCARSDGCNSTVHTAMALQICSGALVCYVRPKLTWCPPFWMYVEQSQWTSELDSSSSGAGWGSGEVRTLCSLQCLHVSSFGPCWNRK